MPHKEEGSSHFLLGVGVGAVLGLLFAPRSGKETRKRLKNDAEYYMDRGNVLYEEARDIYHDARADIEPVVEEVVERAMPVVEAVAEISEPYKEELIANLKSYAKEHIEKELKKKEKKLFNIKK